MRMVCHHHGSWHWIWRIYAKVVFWSRNRHALHLRRILVSNVHDVDCPPEPAGWRKNTIALKRYLPNGLRCLAFLCSVHCHYSGFGFSGRTLCLERPRLRLECVRYRCILVLAGVPSHAFWGSLAEHSIRPPVGNHWRDAWKSLHALRFGLHRGSSLFARGTQRALGESSQPSRRRAWQRLHRAKRKYHARVCGGDELGAKVCRLHEFLLALIRCDSRSLSTTANSALHI
mmetsp:Transcript_71282/g.112941  ORF Transcript_71282/g.112941 Transcript_71282/m.112941 type:complete len:230 (-) Transcript_71282:16-705(-)